MKDHSALAVYLVAAGLVILGLVLLARRLLPRFPGIRVPFPRTTLRESWNRISFLMPVFVLLGLFILWQSYVWAWRWAPGLEMEPPGVSEARWELQGLLSAALQGWSDLIPLHVEFALLILPILYLARRRKTFPYSRSEKTVWVWYGLTLPWIATQIAAHLLSDRENLMRPLLLAYGFLLAPALNLPFLWPPFLALVDERAEQYLATAPRSPARAFSRLFLLQVLAWTLGSVSFFQSLQATLFPAAQWHPSEPLRWTWIVLGFLPALFLVTACFPACSEESLRATISSNRRWWSRDAPFLVILALTAGAASALADLFVRFVLEVISGLPRMELFTNYAVSGLASTAIQIVAFALLLESWLRVQSEVEHARQRRQQDEQQRET